MCVLVRAWVCVCYRGLNSYQYYFLGFLIISNCTIKEPPNPILIIKAPTFCVCVRVVPRHILTEGDIIKLGRDLFGSGLGLYIEGWAFDK